MRHMSIISFIASAILLAMLPSSVLGFTFCRLYKRQSPSVFRHLSTTSSGSNDVLVANKTSEQRVKRVLSGVQPTGTLHLGNYLGAIRQWVEYQELYENYFCVVDLHAITVPHDPKKLSKDTLQSAAMYIAAGIDPVRSKIFVQSHVRAHAELTWLLNCITPMNWLERMIQYKEKALKQGENVGVGLFDYPVLMASDILLYQADLVHFSLHELRTDSITVSPLYRRYLSVKIRSSTLNSPGISAGVSTISSAAEVERLFESPAL